MLAFLEENFGKTGRFEITFGAHTDSIVCDGDTQSAQFQMVDGSLKAVVPYSLLVGADGRNSAICQQLLAGMGKLKIQQYLGPIVWKTMAFPAQANVPRTAFLS
jgi:2-polyprenyl-6-methoxyphenol hydroxylase-like FAD-dependent oxidoreductase